MDILDERILEYLHEEIWATPSTIASDYRFQEMGASEDLIRDHCHLLEERRLVVVISDNIYEISSIGIGYLVGCIDTECLPSPRCTGNG